MGVLDLPSWAPTIQQVADHILARTRLPNGSLAGTFTPETTPTDEMVERIIHRESRFLAPRLGDVPDALADMATEIAAMKAACCVERSYFMEQVATGQSPHGAIKSDCDGLLMVWDKTATGDVPNAPHVASMPIGSLYPGYATGTY